MKEELSAVLTAEEGQWYVRIRDSRGNVAAKIRVTVVRSDWGIPSNVKVKEALDREGWTYIKKVPRYSGVFLVSKKETSGV